MGEQIGNDAKNEFNLNQTDLLLNNIHETLVNMFKG